VITPETLGRALGEAPDPELARVAVSRLGERPLARELLSRPEIIAAAGRLLGFSSAAADFFSAHPEELEELADVRPRSLAELEAECAALAGTFRPAAALRRFRRRAGYRVAARDLAGASVDEVMVELTSIAEACLSTAVASVPEAVGLSIVGLGKLGGRELNYSSDVDVLFVHREPGARSQHAASSGAAAIVSLLSDPTADGVALRVDANLRPEGRSGPLSRSLESMIEYYEHHALTWERQAMLKARPAAGDQRLGAELVARVTPFVYPAVLPSSAIEEVRASKARIEELVRAAGKEASEVKRGRGGIRDVEFAVQLLQLVHGRRDHTLRDPSTLGALGALAEAGYVSDADAEMLASSYRFLRRLEHRLQVARDLQIHELPSDRRALGALARSMGLPDAARLMHEYMRHTETVRGVHERLFYRPLLEAFTGPTAARADREGTEELLTALGFGDPPAAYRAFDALVAPGDRIAKVIQTLFPILGPALAFAALPDAALVRFSRVVEAHRSDHSDSDRLAEMLADRPDSARRLASLVAASSAFADMLVARPNLAASLREPPSPERSLFPGDSSIDLIRVAGTFAAGEAGVPDTGRMLTTVADGLIAEAVRAAAPKFPLAAIALGKLGGEELSFGSDLDVMFVYEGEGPADFAAASAICERILAHVTAAGWQTDPDLRPEGRSGPLARSMASYLEYWERWAETWEYQSLLRARFVAGDEPLGKRFLSNAMDFAYPERLTLEQVVAIRRMRVRMEEERVRPAEARRFHFKLGYGSLADVQFAVELSLMRHGFEHPGVRRTHTLEALEAIAASRLVEDSVARSLADAYVFLMRVKLALEIERRVPCDALPPTPEGQAALARRLGYEDRPRHRFLEDYRRITRKARLAMERVFYQEEGAKP
jgi:[glutamine synthetase] adenylyltransferase / [glutamine synthetase]-adenylyl-L-tyrosine phosphorylase